MKTVICTTGTSISQGIPFDQMNARRIDERLRALLDDDPDNYVTSASAESNSLDRMKLKHNDRVCLLHSETTDGRICAEAVKNLITRSLCPRNIELYKITGLQVADGNSFRRKGINSLFEVLDRICRPLLGRQQPDVWLNITGGFKSVVPYVTLFGQLYQLPVVYIFERSESLIKLPPAAVNFDFERLARAADAIHELEREDLIDEDRFFELIDPAPDHSERDWFSTLLEKEGKEVTLSAFGLLALRIIQEDKATTVKLSNNAHTAYDRASGTAKKQFRYMLERVRNPLWRILKDHAFQGTDLKVAKPGRTVQRMAYFIEDKTVYVCELFPDKRTYQRVLPRNRRARYRGPWTVHP